MALGGAEVYLRVILLAIPLLCLGVLMLGEYKIFFFNINNKYLVLLLVCSWSLFCRSILLEEEINLLHKEIAQLKRQVRRICHRKIVVFIMNLVDNLWKLIMLLIYLVSFYNDQYGKPSIITVFHCALLYSKTSRWYILTQIHDIYSEP